MHYRLYIGKIFTTSLPCFPNAYGHGINPETMRAITSYWTSCTLFVYVAWDFVFRLQDHPSSRFYLRLSSARTIMYKYHLWWRCYEKLCTIFLWIKHLCYRHTLISGRHHTHVRLFVVNFGAFNLDTVENPSKSFPTKLIKHSYGWTIEASHW